MQNKYPLWKNLLLIFLAVISLIYAVPNLYSEEPAVQISSQASSVNASQLMGQVKELLKNANINYQSISSNDDRLEIRFASPDTQLLARDLLKNSLGSQYTVALNLAPSTPKWLSKLGAEPMKQGLDLRGGVHFLLQVDIDGLIARRFEGLIKNISQKLREAGIRYTGIRYIPNKGVDVQFRSDDIMSDAYSEIRKEFPNVTLTKSTSAPSFLASLSSADLNTIRQDTIEQTMTILRKRVNELGVGEAVVQQQGSTRIGVDLPGIQDAARAKQILGGTATLQFYLVDDEHDPFTAKQTGIVPLNTKLYMMEDRPILLKRQIVLSGDSITSAISSFDQQTATPAVQIQLGGGGENFFTKVTRENVGKRMAIVFVETKTTTQKNPDGTEKRTTQKEERIISAPVIQSALGNNFQITGLTDSKEASNLALLLRAGALPAVIYPVEERTVGPSLGKENIQRGLISLEVGMGLILILMLVYYRFFGLVANIGLFLNLILLSALLSLIGTTLTLPGIAGFVLTVGMAVDANVLIYERIREELRHGLSPQAAIFAGYHRALSTIIDANVTTLIVGVVLFAIGTGPVRGFAVILCLGLLTSMLTSVTYTRAIINWYYGGRTVKKLSIGI